MSVVIVTGSSGLIGSEAARFFHGQGFEVVGVDNNMRQYFFGADGSVNWNTAQLKKELKRFTHIDADIRDFEAMKKIFEKYKNDIALVIHTAAQPSHDWAAREVFTDFSVNATGTLNLLECIRHISPEATFIFTSTNKVYGDSPNYLPLVEKETRWELDSKHPFSKHGIDETFSIDQSKHSLFGVSKAAADLLTQEYGLNFGLKTGTFRGGCLTGPQHSGAELHGFLAYLVKCAITGKPYTIFGYKGKQVRDNIHCADLIQSFWHFSQKPKSGAVYNIGGARHSNCSVLEAIDIIEELSGKRAKFTISDQARTGDHIWWISDVRKFQADYPGWSLKYSVKDILREIIEAAKERFLEAA